MITYMDYTKADKHILGENGFDPRFCGKCEAVMSQGNGYLGLRAAAEENYSQTTRGLFVAGTFKPFRYGGSFRTSKCGGLYADGN